MKIFPIQSARFKDRLNTICEEEKQRTQWRPIGDLENKCDTS